MPITKSRFINFILLCTFAFLLTLGFREASAIGQFSNISLRYAAPITGQAAYRARQHSAADTETFWPTFWHQDRAEFSAGTRTVQSNSIAFSGNAALVWPMEFIVGNAPGSIDSSGIAISESLAHSLWGSTDIVGMMVYVDDEPHIVRGVFKGAANIALISFHIEDTSRYWTAVELTRNAPHPTRQDAVSFAQASGLGMPCYVLMGGPMAVARFMAILPFIVLAVYVLVLVVGFVRKYYPAISMPVFFAGLILFAVLLPFLLNVMPAWMIPTRWSDFSFWSSLIQQAGDSLREFFSVNPMLRDVELRMHLLRQVGILMLSVCCSIVVCFRLSQRYKVKFLERQYP